MIDIGGVTYLSIEECLERVKQIPLVISERTFRQKVRIAECGMEHRKQLFLTEDDLNRVLETLRIGKGKKWRSNSGGAAKARTGTSGVQSAEAATTRALALLRSSTPK